jgi:hypothetical protein
MKRFAIVLATVLTTTTSAWAGLPPKLDIAHSCRRAVPLLGDADNNPYQS